MEQGIREKSVRKPIPVLQSRFDLTTEAAYTLEIGIDEAGRGPMLGRVYSAAVILPFGPDPAFNYNHALMKDSKRFHSPKKIHEAAQYIKDHALAWHVAYACEKTIDEINIRNATHEAMHEAIRGVIAKMPNGTKFKLLVDGNDFTPLCLDEEDSDQIPFTCIEGGDNKFSAIAAASILAKVDRDKYIGELCIQQPDLITKYDLLKNKGYGTKKHMDGIKEHGISPLHRQTFGICKQFANKSC
jgi:ribonuclease HII